MKNMEKVPQEVQEFLKAMMDREGEVRHSDLVVKMQRDIRKLTYLLKLMKGKSFGTLTEEQRNFIALGWLCGSYHENSAHLDTVGGHLHSHLMQIIMGAATETPVNAYYDVRENVVVGFLDGEEFKMEKHPETAFTQTSNLIDEREGRIRKILRARKVTEEDEVDMSSSVRKTDKRKMN